MRVENLQSFLKEKLLTNKYLCVQHTQYLPAKSTRFRGRSEDWGQWAASKPTQVHEEDVVPQSLTHRVSGNHNRRASKKPRKVSRGRGF